MYWDKINFRSDKETVSNNWDNKSIRFHYNFIENSIIKYLDECQTVLDIGSGFGHWIKFYQDIYNAEIECIEPCKNEYGIIKYNTVIQKTNINKKFDVINAIGVLHHIMKDNDLKLALSKINNMMHKDSLLFIGTRIDFLKNPKEKLRKFRTLNQWAELLSDFNIIGIERSNPPIYCRKHLDLIIIKRL